MAQRRNANRIRGPQSALTDFLAANNISAAQIRQTYEQRAQQAQTPVQQPSITRAPTRVSERSRAIEEQVAVEGNVADHSDASSNANSDSGKKKRKRENAKKGKSSKKLMKKGKSDDEYSDDDYNDVLGRGAYKKAAANPGQLENCELCDKRFTVTAYSRNGPSGGLLCGSCGRELLKAAGDAPSKPKKTVGGKGRRKFESSRLDGDAARGSKTLRQLCIEKVADSHLDVEDFGDIPDGVITRLSEIFAKRRIIDPRTLRLFLRNDSETIAIHDCAELEAEDYQYIFAVVPGVVSLTLRNACQFKDSVMSYITGRVTELKHVKLYAANLITNAAWINFFSTHGHQLLSLQLEWLDASFNDDVFMSMVTSCKSLRRLKLKYCRQITSAALQSLTQLTNLRHLSLQFSSPTGPREIEDLVTSVGQHLETLSLEDCVELDDPVIHAIRTHCTKLTKLRLTPLDSSTDLALQSLFGGVSSEPTVVPSLHFIDLDSARDVDNNNPNGPVDMPVGLSNDGFKALMQHSGSRLRRLEIPSCRHISHATMWDVFVGPRTDSSETGIVYPELKIVNVSFVPGVDSSIIAGILRSCPKITKLVAFGCFKIQDVPIRDGVTLIGVPKAQDAIEQFGTVHFNEISALSGFLDDVILVGQNPAVPVATLLS